MTRDFREALYSHHPISAQVADAVRRHWERVRQALQARREKKGR